MTNLKQDEVVFRHAHENTGVDGEPFVYNLVTGVVRVSRAGDIGGEEFVIFADKVRKARIRAGLDQDQTRGGNTTFVAGHMNAAELDEARKDLGWRNLVNSYPPPYRERLAGNVKEARKRLEKGVPR